MPLSLADAVYLSSLRQNTRRLLTTVLGEDCSEVVLLDTPRHKNSGDSLIWMGELRYMSDLGIQVRYHTDIGRYFREDLRRVSSSTPILLHGGGNLGDLYPRHDEFRRLIIAQFPDRRIIMLPQPIQYLDYREAAKASAEYAIGNNLTILLRDTKSLERATTILPSVDVRFCNDMAFGAPLDGVTAGSHASLLVLSRSDSETAMGHRQPEEAHAD